MAQPTHSQPLTLQAASAPNLLEWQNSSGSILFSVPPATQEPCPQCGRAGGPKYVIHGSDNSERWRCCSECWAVLLAEFPQYLAWREAQKGGE